MLIIDEMMGSLNLMENGINDLKLLSKRNILKLKTMQEAGGEERIDLYKVQKAEVEANLDMDLGIAKEAMAFVGKVIVTKLGHLVKEGKIKCLNQIYF